jgi:nitrogen regulatory protein P-II 1
MKKIVCVIKPFKLQDVLNSLKGYHIEGLTITEVKGYGRQKSHLELYHGSEYKITFLPKIKLEMVVNDSDAPEIVEKVRQNAHTGRIGDGKIFVLSAESASAVPTTSPGQG